MCDHGNNNPDADKGGGQYADQGSISPAALIDQSYCSSHNYFGSTYNLQMVMNGVWSYTMWVQYEGDKGCGAVEYQKTRCYLDWGVLWTATWSDCGALPAA